MEKLNEVKQKYLKIEHDSGWISANSVLSISKQIWIYYMYLHLFSLILMLWINMHIRMAKDVKFSRML